MNIGLIGCGRVGTTLFYLLKKNNTIVGVYDLNKKHEKKARTVLNIKPNPPLETMCRSSEALFFATPDDQILKAYRVVKPHIGSIQYLYHFSGLLPADIFPRAKTTFRGAVHPFATVPVLIIPPRRKRYFLYVEGDTQAVSAAKKIFSRQYFTIRHITKRRKVYYHLVGVFASNLMVGLYSAIDELAHQLKWSSKEVNDVVVPIIEETLDNIQRYGIRKSLSGPLERGDLGSLKKHMTALEKKKHLQSIYRVLSRYIVSKPGRRRKKVLEKLLA